MKLNHSISLTALAALFSIALSACGVTDVVAKVANASFTSIAEASASRVSWVEEDSAWALASIAGDRILFSSDFSRNSTTGGMADMDKPDVEFEFDAAPFIAAGLDLAKLPAADGIKYELEDGTFMLHFELGPEAFAAGTKESLAATFAEIVRTQRQRVGYHEKLDHYGLALGGGNMFEWAKDMSKNDKDIVWVLNPQPFIAAGVDPNAIKGWIFAKVEIKDEAGKAAFVDKLLKPFDL